MKLGIEELTLALELVVVGSTVLAGVWKLSSALTALKTSSEAQTQTLLALRDDLTEERDERKSDIKSLTHRVDNLVQPRDPISQH